MEANESTSRYKQKRLSPEARAHGQDYSKHVYSDCFFGIMDITFVMMFVINIWVP